MLVRYGIPRQLLSETFAYFRACGRGRCECQVLWVSPWNAPETITKVVHPTHQAHAGGFILDDRWLNNFWIALAHDGLGVRIQVHTHPAEAFHSATDDAFPIIHTVGFLSLVIPNFGLGPIDLQQAYLTEIGEDGGWHEVFVRDRLVLT